MEFSYEKIKKLGTDELIKIGYEKPFFSLGAYHGSPFDGRVNIHSKEIALLYDFQFSEKYPKKAEEIILFLLRHEISHVGYGCKGCPQNEKKSLEYFSNPIWEILSKKGFNKEQSIQIDSDVMNLITNFDFYTNGEYSFEGFIPFTAESLRRFREEDNIFFYEYSVLVKSLLHLFGNEGYEGLETLCSNEKVVNTCVEKFLDRTKGLDFFNESNWKEISIAYAEEVPIPLKQNGLMD